MSDIQAYSDGFTGSRLHRQGRPRQHRHHLYQHRQGRAHLLAERQQGRRRLRGLLRRLLGQTRSNSHDKNELGTNGSQTPHRPMTNYPSPAATHDGTEKIQRQDRLAPNPEPSGQQQQNSLLRSIALAPRLNSSVTGQRPPKRRRRLND